MESFVICCGRFDDAVRIVCTQLNVAGRGSVVVLDMISVLIGREGFSVGMHERRNHSSSAPACELGVTGDGCEFGEKIDSSSASSLRESGTRDGVLALLAGGMIRPQLLWKDVICSEESSVRPLSVALVEDWMERPGVISSSCEKLENYDGWFARTNH